MQACAVPLPRTRSPELPRKELVQTPGAPAIVAATHGTDDLALGAAVLVDPVGLANSA